MQGVKSDRLLYHQQTKNYENTLGHTQQPLVVGCVTTHPTTEQLSKVGSLKSGNLLINRQDILTFLPKLYMKISNPNIYKR